MSTKQLGCDCVFCSTYKLYKYAIVNECKCSCHIKFHEHSSLCCGLANVPKTIVPENMTVEPSQYYHKLLTAMDNEDEKSEFSRCYNSQLNIFQPPKENESIDF